MPLWLSISDRSGKILEKKGKQLKNSTVYVYILTFALRLTIEHCSALCVTFIIKLLKPVRFTGLYLLFINCAFKTVSGVRVLSFNHMLQCGSGCYHLPVAPFPFVEAYKWRHATFLEKKRNSFLKKLLCCVLQICEFHFAPTKGLTLETSALQNLLRQLIYSYQLHVDN